MAKRPEDRFASASELALALDHALAQTSTGEGEFRARLERAQPPTAPMQIATAGPTAVLPRATPPAQRPRARPRRLLWAPLVLLLIAGGIVALSAVWRRRWWRRL